MSDFVTVKAPTAFRTLNIGDQSYHFDGDCVALLPKDVASALPKDYIVVGDAKVLTETKPSGTTGVATAKADKAPTKKAKTPSKKAS